MTFELEAVKALQNVYFFRMGVAYPGFAQILHNSLTSQFILILRVCDANRVCVKSIPLTPENSMSSTRQQSKHFFICGSALRGQPDHDNLGEAQFIRAAITQPRYRLHAAADGWHPAIYEVSADGMAIPGEVYAMTDEQYEYLLAHEPPNMYPGTLILEDGSSITAMLYPRELVEQFNWPDISTYGGWAAYKAATTEES